MSANESFIYVIVGAPGSGKSSQVRIALADQGSRCMVFDPMKEFGSHLNGDYTLEATRKLLLTLKDFSLVYKPDTNDPAKMKQRFDVWCKLAFAAGNLLVVVDEAADVTSSNRYEVPEGWSTLLRQGRHQGVRIVAATQRPADIDKRLWSFATRIRTGRLNYGSDQVQLANVLNVDVGEVQSLVERQWIERDMRTGQVTRGSMEWIRGVPVNVPRGHTTLVQPKPEVKKPAPTNKKKPARKKSP